MEMNMVVTGDQARLLIQVLTNPSVSYKGNVLPDLYLLFGQLLAISNVQPAVTNQQASS